MLFRSDEQEFLAAGGSKVEFNRYDLNHDGVLDDQELALRQADQSSPATSVREYIMQVYRDQTPAARSSPGVLYNSDYSGSPSPLKPFVTEHEGRPIVLKESVKT